MTLPPSLSLIRRAPRVLVVDDIEMIRLMVAELLHNDGFDVETAGNAEEALALGRLMRWDGLVLDVDMPGTDGLALYTEMVRLNRDERLPVVFFSGRRHEALQMSLMGTPWVQFILKPCPGDQLVRIMRQCLQAVGPRQGTCDAV